MVPAVRTRTRVAKGRKPLVVRMPKRITQKAKRSRAGWTEAFAALASHADEEGLAGLTPTDWELTEWEW
jgi:hypothetical protein